MAPLLQMLCSDLYRAINDFVEMQDGLDGTCADDSAGSSGIYVHLVLRPLAETHCPS
jgi:hypothetical protein